jgi:hypothetical protein
VRSARTSSRLLDAREILPSDTDKWYSPAKCLGSIPQE